MRQHPVIEAAPVLKDTAVLAVLRSLAEYPSARSACAAGIGAGALPAYERALAALAESQMITKRPAS
jgi:putative mycofactocin binding protein MftB